MSSAELLKTAVDSFGRLVGVVGTFSDEPHPSGLVRFEQFEFEFLAGVLTVVANANDDTVDVLEGPASLPHRTVLTSSSPWSSAIGSGVLWAWLLKNQQGYRDGFQIEFQWDGGRLVMQLMCEASAFTVYRLHRLDEPSTSP